MYSVFPLSTRAPCPSTSLPLEARFPFRLSQARALRITRCYFSAHKSTHFFQPDFPRSNFIGIPSSGNLSSSWMARLPFLCVCACQNKISQLVCILEYSSLNNITVFIMISECEKMYVFGYYYYITSLM